MNQCEADYEHSGASGSAGTDLGRQEDEGACQSQVPHTRMWRHITTCISRVQQCQMQQHTRKMQMESGGCGVATPNGVGEACAVVVLEARPNAD